jgi:hypothetical protein|tara:strand:- start:10281 stop:10487 length:207 start_codon:yes stop_codon:yes gene_type:complete
MSSNTPIFLEILLMMKKNNRQNEFIFAVVAIILTIVFLGTLFYVKSKNIEKEEIAIQPPIAVSYFSAI